jgi:hypothetical protein
MTKSLSTTSSSARCNFVFGKGVLMYTYLASPYSAREGTGAERYALRQKRFYRAMHALQWMSNKRLWAYSPIVHCHEMADRYSFPTDYHFWNDMNHAFIRPAESVTILCILGWRESAGVTHERQFATEIEKPIHFLLPRDLGDYELLTSEPFDA